jgi:uncharacterized membrane protein
MSKTIKILILGSVVLNILLLGIIIGNVSQRFFREDSLRRTPSEWTVKLPPEKERLFSGTMGKVRSENREIRKQIREGREKIFSILTAPQFDETAYESETKKLHERRMLMMHQLSDSTKQLARQFNQEERKALAEQLKRSQRARMRDKTQ